jgi:hypothetical protein
VEGSKKEPETCRLFAAAVSLSEWRCSGSTDRKQARGDSGHASRTCKATPCWNLGRIIPSSAEASGLLTIKGKALISTRIQDVKVDARPNRHGRLTARKALFWHACNSEDSTRFWRANLLPVEESRPGSCIKAALGSGGVKGCPILLNDISYLVLLHLEGI